MKKNEWFIAPDGTRQCRPKNLKKQMNLQYLDITNKTKACGIFDLPELKCDTAVYPDYLALYTQPGYYHKTPHTAVCFFLYDDKFDGQHGLANAIYYNNEADLQYYRERFKDVSIFISPDYSLLGDIDALENLYRMRRARTVALWLTLEIGAIVIPLISYPTLDYLEDALCGLESCTVVALSTKGYVTDPIESDLLKQAIRRIVDYLNLKAIVVYDTCGDNYRTYELFEYAIAQGIQIIIPPNSLKDRNALKKGGGRVA